MLPPPPFCTLVPLFWVGCTALALLSIVLPAAKALGEYHTSRTGSNRRPPLSVPKSYFAHFYAVGSLVNGAVWATGWPCAPHPALACLFQAHLLRRLYECHAVHVSNPTATMPLQVYAGGLAHYVMAPLSLGGGTGGAPALAAVVFVAANAVQHAAHRHLASLRKHGTTVAAGVYKAPTSPLFALVVCPHYTAEIVLYAALWAARPSLTTATLAAWVVCNLAITARRTLAWYASKDLGGFPGRRKAVLPWVL